MVVFRLLICCCLAAVVIAADDDWEMRSRVYCDAQAGITFRYPYELYAPDQYKPELTRQRRFIEPAAAELKEIEIEGKIVKVVVEREEAPRIPDVRAFSALASTLPVEVAGGGLAAVGNHLTGRKLSWSPFTYYGKSEERPHANPFPCQIGRAAQRRVHPAHQRRVVKAAHHHHRQRGQSLAGRLGLRERCQRDLAQIEIACPRHAAEGAGDRVHRFPGERNSVRSHRAVLQRHHMRIIRQRRFQRDAHGAFTDG